MPSETCTYDVINDGTFSLDPGAAFGTTPRNIWSREFQLNDNYRISLNSNICAIREGDKNYLVDSGIGDSPGKYLEKWFEASPNGNLKNCICIATRIRITLFSIFYPFQQTCSNPSISMLPAVMKCTDSSVIPLLTGMFR